MNFKITCWGVFALLYSFAAALSELGSDETSIQADVNLQPFYFTQQTTHFASNPPPGFNTTFKQRYWIDTAHYSYGGPVILLDAADKSGDDILPLLHHGIVQHLAKETCGVIILLEQRYYGASHVSSNLSVPNLQLLNTDEALADIANFAAKFPSGSHPELNRTITKDFTPWIVYGFWVGGAKAALLRKLYPAEIWGSIASSATVLAVENIWQYLEAIRVVAEPTCISVVTSVVADIDDEISRAGTDNAGQIVKSDALVAYMALFNLTNQATVKNFMNQVATPLGLWQKRSWQQEQPDAMAWDYFCSNLTQRLSESVELSNNMQKTIAGVYPWDRLSSFRRQAILNYGRYIKHYLAVGHQRDPPLTAKLSGRDGDFFALGEIRRNKTESQRTDLGQIWRLWYWQACTEWGFFSTAQPEPMPTVLSRSLDLFYLTEVCRFAFNFGDDYHVPTERINKYGNVTINAPRLLYVDGDQDPWIYATRHTKFFNESISSTQQRGGVGLLIEGAGHAEDRIALPNLADEPSHIQTAHKKEIEMVKSWVAAWYAEKIEL